METKRLEMFVALVEEGGFRPAADSLFMSQPALSQQIAKLEDAIGVQLFDRSTRPAAVTAAGREFYFRCKRVLDAMRGIDTLLDDAKGAKLGRIRIGIVPSMMYGRVPSVIKSFRDAHPGAEIRLTPLATTQLREELESGQIDVAIVLTDLQMNGLVSQTLFTEPFLLGVSEDHRLAALDEVPFEELRGESIITIPRHAAPENHDALVVACMQAGFSPRGPVASGSYLEHIALVSAGFGVCFVPESLTTFTMHNVVYRPLREPTVDASVTIAWFDQRIDMVGSLFVQHCLREFAGRTDAGAPVGAESAEPTATSPELPINA